MSNEKKVFSDYEQGSARFAEAEEIRRATTQISLLDDNCECGGLPLYSNGSDELWVDGKEPHNTLIASATGGGKSRKIITPILLSDIAAGNSIIVTDPKAELLKSSYEFLKKHNYEIKVLNFRDPKNSDHYNPLYRGASFYKERPDLAAEAFCEIAECIYSQSVHSEKDPFWEHAAANLCSGLALLASAHCEPEEVTLGLIYRMYIDASKPLGGSNYIKEYLSNANNPIIEEALSGYVNAPKDTKTSIDAVFATPLSKLIINRSIDEMLSGGSFIAEDFVEKKTALFICLRDESNTYSPIVSLLVNELYSNLINYAEQHGGTLPRMVDMVLDEFGNFPKIADFSNKISASRSRGIRFSLCLQSLYQLNSVYGEDTAQIILGNCDNMVLLAGRDMKLLQHFSERCGDVYGRYSQEKRPLLPPAAIQHLSKEAGEVLFLYGAEYPYIAELPDRSVYMEKLGLEELTEIPQINDDYVKPEKEFSLKKYVDDMRDKKIQGLMNDGKNKNPSNNTDKMLESLFGSKMQETIEKTAAVGEEVDRRLSESKGGSESGKLLSEEEMINMVNNTPGGISVDELVARIDSKIAELEELERIEKMEKEEHDKKEHDSDKKNVVETNDTDNGTESGEEEPVPLS